MISDIQDMEAAELEELLYYVAKEYAIRASGLDVLRVIDQVKNVRPHFTWE